MPRKLAVEITANTRKLQKALGGTQSSMQKLGKAAGIAGLAIAGGFAIAAKIGFDELSEMQKATAQTEAVLKSTGHAANVTSEHVRELAESISAYSGMDDEAVQAGENLLLTFHKIQNVAGKNNDIFDQATKATADLAQAMGMDMTNAAILVGKALNDPIRGLGRLQRIGVVFDDQQKKTIEGFMAVGDVASAQKVILEELNKEFGGSAKAFGETMPGKIKIAQESFRNLSAELMMVFLPALIRIGETLSRFADFLRENPKLAKAMVIALGALAIALLTASAAQLALNLAVLANPYVLAAAAIIALGVGLVVLWKKVEFVRKHWQLLLLGFGLAPAVIATIVKAIIRHFDTLKAVFNAVRSLAQRVFPAVAAAVRVMLGPILVVIGAVQRLIDLIGRIPDIPDLNPFGGAGAGSPTGRGGSGGRANPNDTNSLRLRPALGGGAAATAGAGGPTVVVMQLDGREVGRALLGMDKMKRRKTGGRGLLD